MPRHLLVLALTLVGCSTVHGIRPIGKGNVSLDASLGGPITQVFGAPIPLPLTTLGATVGVGETTDVHAAFHPTAAAMFGIGAGELGASQQLLAPSGARPRLMVDLTLLGAAGDVDPDHVPTGGFRFFAQPTLISGWDWGKQKKQTIYLGLTAFVEPGEEWAALGGIVLGNRFSAGRSRVDVELKWLDPWASNAAIVPEFAAPGGLGAVEFQVGYGFTFGKRANP